MPIILPLILLGQDGYFQTGARGSAMAGSTSTMSDVWSTFNNVAGLAKINNQVLGLSHQYRWQLPEIQTLAVSYVHPLSSLNLGISFFRFGDNLYHQQKAAISVSNQIDFVSLGFSANLIQYHFEGFGSGKSLVLEFGGLIDLNPEWSLAAHIFNLNLARLSQNFSIPVIMKVGASYHPGYNLTLNTEVRQEVGRNTYLSAGLEYKPLEWVAIRTGISGIHSSGTFGLGFQKYDLGLDYGFIPRPVLGSQQEISLFYNLGKLK